jgi:hypothetical protein
VVVIAMVAIPVAYAQAHEGAHAVISGPTSQGTVQLAENHKFQIPGITIDCPPPEGGRGCKVEVTVRTKAKLRLKAGQKKKVWRVGKVRFNLGANRDAAPLLPILIDTNADKLLGRHGSLKTKIYVEVNHDEQVERSFSMTLKDHE